MSAASAWPLATIASRAAHAGGRMVVSLMAGGRWKMASRSTSTNPAPRASDPSFGPTAGSRPVSRRCTT